MKKLLLLIFVLIITSVSCSSEETTEEIMLDKLSYSSFSIRWGDGTLFNIDDKEIVNNFLELISEKELKKDNKEETEGYLYFIDMGSEIRIVNGSDVIFNDERYVFKNSLIKEEIEVILSDYIPDTTNEDTDESIRENTMEYEITKVDEFDIEKFNYVGTLRNATEVYYEPSRNWNKQETCSDIVIKIEDEFYSLIKGRMPLPAISPDRKSIAFVDYIGFEVRGNIFIYNSLSESIEQITYDNYGFLQDEYTTIKQSVWYDNETLLVIIGYDTGTITQGGNVYTININTEERKKIIETNEKEEIVNLRYYDNNIILEVVKWTDDNYIDYEYYNKYIDVEILPSEAIIIDDNMITSEEVVSAYTDSEVLSTLRLEDIYLLVEYQIPTHSNKFNLHNLKTGKIDSISTAPDFVTIYNIVDENEILFLSDGTNSENYFKIFPYLIESKRVIGDNGIDYFESMRKEMYFSINDEVTGGNDKSQELFDIKIISDALQLFFKPEIGEESDFHAAASTIPETNIYYDDITNSLVIKLLKTPMTDFTDDYLIDNRMIKDIDIEMLEEDVFIYVELNDSNIEYLPTIINESLPILDLKLRNK